MNYNETIEWLFQQLPMFQNKGKVAYKADLSNIIKFCEHLGNPQNNFKSIHVAGTNGKGSTSHMLASVLQEADYKTALHTSPHLKDFRERSKINGKLMPKSFVIDFVKKNKDFIESLSASFFEVAVAMGFLYFSEEKVDIAVIETGLGGRLDSTNIIQPEISIITNIGKDHTSILGETFEKIAKEKAGIIKPKTPIIIGEYITETLAIFKSVAKQNNSPIYFAQDSEEEIFPCDLKGKYQFKNQKTAVTAIGVLQKLGWNISDENIKLGLSKIVKNTNLRGRWDILEHKPFIVADTAHNPAGIEEITAQIRETKHDKLHLVLGFVNDKDVVSVLNYFPKDAIYYFSAPDVPRKLDIENLKKIVPKNLNAFYFKTIKKALKEAKTQASENDMIYIGGSTFVVAEVI